MGSKITADGDCSHEITTLTPQKESISNRRVLLGLFGNDYLKEFPSDAFMFLGSVVMSLVEIGRLELSREHGESLK